MKTVYILLSKTGTFPSRVIHFLKGGPFTHASFSFVPSTEHFYSYARRNPKNFLVAGLIMENLHTDVFAHYKNCRCALYSLEVSEEDYGKMQELVNYYLHHYKQASYNMLGMPLLGLGIRVRRKYKLTCSQFVALILNCAKQIKLPKDPYLMLPNDFVKVKDLALLYDGPIKDCTCHAFRMAEPVVS